MDEKRLREEQVRLALAEPFPASVVGWKPQTLTKDKRRCLAVAYIDARDVMNRLDDVVGIGGWQDSYEVLAGRGVVCTLSVRVGQEWISHQDVGEGDDAKAAFSDALKRAAVKFGVGRYLYRLDLKWVDYDEQNQTIPGPPALPEWALPLRLGVAQQKVLAGLLQQTSSDTLAFCRLLGAESLADLRRSWWTLALTLLEEKLARKAEPVSAGGNHKEGK